MNSPGQVVDRAVVRVVINPDQEAQGNVVPLKFGR